MNNVQLDEDEKKLLKAYEAGEFESKLTSVRKERIQQAAATHTFEESRQVNIRISSLDLAVIQKRALVEGIPYQTLLSGILHKYASGSLRDLTANKHARSESAKPQ